MALADFKAMARYFAMKIGKLGVDNTNKEKK